MKIMNTGIIITSSFFLIGCGGGGGTSTTPKETIDKTPTNVALSTKGAIASATSSNERASLVNDGDNTPNNDWSAQDIGDFINVTFDKVYSVSEISIYLNKANNQDTQLQVSEDGQSWVDIGYFSECDSLQMSAQSGVDAAKIECGFDTPKALKAVRYQILDGVVDYSIDNSIDSLAIYEIEVTGK